MHLVQAVRCLDSANEVLTIVWQDGPEEPHSFWVDVKEREFRKALDEIKSKASLDLETINVR